MKYQVSKPEIPLLVIDCLGHKPLSDSMETLLRWIMYEMSVKKGGVNYAISAKDDIFPHHIIINVIH